MQNITSIAELKNAIQLLEVEQADKGQLVKEQFFITYESLKPVNLLRSSVNDIASSPYLIDNILGAAMGFVSGFVSKKIFIGSSGNKLRQLLGHVLQLGVTNFVALHPGAVRTIGWSFIQHLIRKKRIQPEKQ
jgi:hypothetical protein